MRAYAVTAFGQPLEAIDLPTPEPTGEQVLLEVTHAGVCHSDLHIWDGEYDLGSHGKLRMADRGLKLPLVLGHEIVGRVAKLGPDAEVYVCEISADGQWLGVVYDPNGLTTARCGVTRAVDVAKPYTGPCQSGWVFGKYVDVYAG